MAETREECRECLGALSWLQECYSVICRWIWGWQDARSELDDDREAQEIAEAMDANDMFIRCVASKLVPGRRIAQGDVAEVQALARLSRSELEDVVAYDEWENERHRREEHCASRARAVAALLSRGGEAVEAQSNPVHGGLTEPVWPEMVTRTMVAGE